MPDSIFSIRKNMTVRPLSRAGLITRTLGKKGLDLSTHISQTLKAHPEKDVSESDLRLRILKDVSISIKAATDKETGKIKGDALDAVSSAISKVMMMSFKFKVGLSVEEYGRLGLSQKDVKKVLIDSNLVYEEDTKVASKVVEGTKNLIKTNKNIWDTIYHSVIQIGMGPGVSIYEVNPDEMELHERLRRDLNGESRYANTWGSATGEKAQLIEILNEINAMCNTGGAKKDAHKYRMLMRQMKVWHIKQRNIWPEYGFTPELLQRALSTVKIEKSKYNEILNEVAKGNNKVLSDEIINAMFYDKARVLLSKETLKENGLTELDEFINHTSSMRVFKKAIFNYFCALSDIQRDKEISGSSEEGFPGHVMENLYGAVLDEKNRPIAIVQINDQKIAKEGNRACNLFEGKERNRTFLLQTFGDICDGLALALKNKLIDFELKKDKEQVAMLLALSNMMNDSSNTLNERLSASALILQSLCKKNGEIINSSIQLIDQNNSNELKTVARTKGIATDVIDISESSEDITKISAWISQIKEDIFVFKGKMYKGGKAAPMSDEELSAIKAEYPNMFPKLEKIMSNPEDTFISIPMISNGKLIGVVNIDGAKLNIQDKALLKSAANIMSMAVNNTFQSEELGGKNAELAKALVEVKAASDTKHKLFREKEVQAITDKLTGLFNRSILDTQLAEITNKMLEMGSDVSVMMLDIDLFKKVNDNKGHKTGDRVLAEVSKMIKDFIGEEGMVFRYGGEEILVILRHYNKRDANTKGEQLREKIQDHSIAGLDGVPLNVTVSIGIASMTEDFNLREENAYDKFIDKADTALYGAKEAGRNQCWMYNHDVGRRVEETRRMKKDAAQTIKDLINQLHDALERQDVEYSSKLLIEIDKAIDLLKRREI